MESKTKENAVIYGRMSKDKGETKTSGGGLGNESLDVQEACCVRYCEFKEFNVIATFGDNNTTGDMDKVPFEKRKGAKCLVDMINGGKSEVKHVVISKLDRLGRRAEHMLGRVRWLKEKDITLHIVNLGGDIVTTNGPAGKLMISILSSFAEYDLEMIRERTREALQHKRENGERVCRSCYGWNNVDSGQTRTVNGNEKAMWNWVPNQAEQEWIRFMADMRNQPDPTNIKERGLKTGYWRIAAALNDKGVKTKNKGTWSGGMVHRILNSKQVKEMM